MPITLLKRAKKLGLSKADAEKAIRNYAKFIKGRTKKGGRPGTVEPMSQAWINIPNKWVMLMQVKEDFSEATYFRFLKKIRELYRDEWKCIVCHKDLLIEEGTHSIGKINLTPKGPLCANCKEI